MLLLMCVVGLVFKQTEAILFTTGGLILDSTLAFYVFGKYLVYPLVSSVSALGKRSVDPPTANATPDQYLSVANSVDTYKCIPLAVCTAMAKSQHSDSNITAFDELIVRKFQNLLKTVEAEKTTVSLLSFYLEAAKLGQSTGSIESCRLVSPTCNYTMEELSQFTSAVSLTQL
ncbi:hypothetical protein CHUAL_012146 [Chamberlinius hualienensis]